jgi:hypothetical protein
MKFHHIGVPTTRVQAGEKHLADAKLYVTDPEANEHRIEWLRFETGSPMPAELQARTHIAFEVADLDAVIQGKPMLIEPFEPLPGVRAAFVMDGDVPVEYMQIVR